VRFADLIAIVNHAYPDNMIKNYYEEPNGAHWDGLAKFIVVELEDHHHESLPYEDQLEDAMSALDRAVDELNSVIGHLDEMRGVPADCPRRCNRGEGEVAQAAQGTRSEPAHNDLQALR
jgi:hypothetical protein